MKIQQKFIPLILSGEKKYELRNSKDKEGLYEIGNKYFELLLNCSIWRNRFEDIIDWCKEHYVDSETLKWVKKNKGYFKDEKDNSYYVIIYTWKPLKEQKLEIIGE